ncbi:MAG: nucleoside monophosphate kinase, partial [Gemmatimonadetes bacterium]|nr:nucleoside monophosphate kinase [Gemmatimonadota bacterium]
GLTRAASGDLFREHQQNSTELGKLARSYMDKGVLVPDDVTIRMVTDWINGSEQAQGFVLDGFPRNIAQAEALDRELAGSGGIDRVLSIRVSEKEQLRRLAGRLVCRNCLTAYHERFSPPKVAAECDRCGGELYQREDDRPEAVKTRIEVYLNETEPLIGYYSDAGILREIDGEAPIDEVARALMAAVRI